MRAPFHARVRTVYMRARLALRGTSNERRLHPLEFGIILLSGEMELCARVDCASITPQEIAAMQRLFP